MYRHERVWAKSYGHNHVRAQMCLGTNVRVQKRAWAQTCVGTNVSEHKLVWAQTCLGTTCMDTNVCGHKHGWAQTCLGTIMYGHKRDGTVLTWVKEAQVTTLVDRLEECW